VDEAALQRALDKQVEDATAAAPPPPAGAGTGTPRPHGRRNLLASNLPRVALEILDAVREAHGCRRVGFEDAAQLAYRPGGYYVLVKRLAKYEVVEDRAATVVTTPSPATLFPKGLLHTSTIAHVLTSKFALGTPHYRLEQALADQGVPLDRGLMSRYVEHAGNTLGATIVAAMWRDALAHGHVISTDATGALIQPTKAKDGRSLACKKGHFFTAVVDAEAVLFQYVERGEVHLLHVGVAEHAVAAGSHAGIHRPDVECERSGTQGASRLTTAPPSGCLDVGHWFSPERSV
jgi:transposase